MTIAAMMKGLQHRNHHLPPSTSPFGRVPTRLCRGHDAPPFSLAYRGHAHIHLRVLRVRLDGIVHQRRSLLWSLFGQSGRRSDYTSLNKKYNVRCVGSDRCESMLFNDSQHYHLRSPLRVGRAHNYRAPPFLSNNMTKL